MYIFVLTLHTQKTSIKIGLYPLWGHDSVCKLLCSSLFVVLIFKDINNEWRNIQARGVYFELNRLQRTWISKACLTGSVGNTGVWRPIEFQCQDRPFTIKPEAAGADHLSSCAVISHTHTDTLVDLISSIPAISRPDNQKCAVITLWNCVLRETNSNAELNQAWNLDLIAWLRADCNWPHWELMVDWTVASHKLNAVDIILTHCFCIWSLKKGWWKRGKWSLNEYEPGSS